MRGRQGLERQRTPEDRHSSRKNLAVKGGIIFLLVLLTLAAFPRRSFYQYAVQVGDEWRQETLEAPVDFAIYKSPETLEREREEVRYRTPPYFREVPNPLARIQENRDTLTLQLDRSFAAYESYLRNRSRGRTAEAAQDTATYSTLRRNSRLNASVEQWQILAESYAGTVPGLTVNSGAVSSTRLDRRLLQEAWEQSVQLVNVGVLDVPVDSVYTDEIIVRNTEENTFHYRDKTTVFGLEEAYGYVQEQFARAYEGQPEIANLGTAFFHAVFQPSLEYLRGETMREWQRLQRAIPPAHGRVLRGEVIVRKGERVTEEISRKLASLERKQSEQTGNSIPWQMALGQFLLTLAVYLLFFLYLFLLRRSVFDDNSKVLLIALLFAGITGLFATALRLPNAPMFAVPVAIASVLLTVIFDSRVGLFGTLALALIGGSLLNYDFEFTFATIFAGALGVFSVRDIRNRGQFFLCAGLVFVGYALVLTASWLMVGVSVERLLESLLLVGINSFLLIMAYPLLWVFERAFDVTTDLTLLELSDTNRPLVKELSVRAPGTFNHSLQVANLAEAAADAIGAHALLARVGALYHDIGKMLKPEYFVENQRPGHNPHDQLKPRMSALIIASHVKEGLELGRQYNLPERVLRFIPMHHGTTRIEYFFQRAIEQRGTNEPPLLESEFRYPGPRPNSKETGIMMLADSVEAACRSITEPTHKRLEALVEMIFKARIEDGQLDDTELTFKDLTRTKETFLAMLLGIYHLRVKYPGQRQAESDAGATDDDVALRDEAAVQAEDPMEASGDLTDRPENGSGTETPEEIPVADAGSMRRGMGTPPES